jgi:hypothetical protein
MYEPFNLLDLYKKSNSSIYNINKGYINLINISKIKLINKAINLTEKFDSFIDIGACNHEFSELLINKGFSKGHAVEIIPTSSLKNFSIETSNFFLFEGLIQDFDENHFFDFVLMSEVFEHIPLDDIDLVIKKIESITKKNSIVFISTPDPIFCGPATRSDIYFEKLLYGHYKHYLKDEIVKYFLNFDLVIYEKIEGKLEVKFNDKLISFRRRTKNLPFFLKKLLNKILFSIQLIIFKMSKNKNNNRTQVLVFKRK